jgi:hypothetical protein
MTTFNFSSDKDQVIFFELTPKLKKENITDSFLAKVNGTNKASGGFIELKLNSSKYKGKTIISDIYPDTWSKTIKQFRQRAQDKGLSNEHIEMFLDVLDSNAGKLIKQISDEKLQEATWRTNKKDLNISHALSMVKAKTVELFLDQVKKPFIAIKMPEDYIQTIAIQSRTFEDWLTATYYFESKHAEELESEPKSEDKTKYDAATNSHRIDHDQYPDEDDALSGRRVVKLPKILGNEEVSKIQTILRFEAERKGEVKTLNVRVASAIDTSSLAELDNNAVYYDLCNPKWEIVKITRHGWNIEKKYPQNLFKRFSGMYEQVLPKSDYPPDILERFIKLTNVCDSEDSNLLAKVYLISLFLLAELPKPIMVPHGIHGSGKSTFQEFVKRIVDPEAALTCAFPNSLPELVQQLDHSYLTFFDNVSEIKGLTSDTLCRAVTGSGLKKRGLYTDDEDFIYNMKRPIGFNGINITANKADLLDRIINLELQPIDKRKRRKVEHLQSEFEIVLPQLLGYIFDMIAKVLNHIGEVKLEELPRMADFAEMGELIARCLGYPENKFTETYNRNIGFTNQEAIESSPVATALIELMGSIPVWTGKATGLKIQLSDLIESKREFVGMKYSKSWPKSPRALRERLKEIEPNLKEVGIIVSYKEDTHTKSDTITIVNNNYITKDQTFWATFEELEAEEAANPENMTSDDKTTINGIKLQSRLVDSGKFDVNEANQAIADRVKDGSLKRVMEDTYRRGK